MSALKELELPPTEEDMGRARKAEEELRQAFPELQERQEPTAVSLGTAGADGANGARVSVVLPASVLRLLLQVLHLMAEGKAVALFPYHAELTTQEAADLLNVSRPFLVGLCDSGQIPYTRPGRHRRIRLQDLLAYMRRHDEERERLLTELVEEAQEHGFGY